uniref:lytic cellulose monooxygenase (C4-dehydrogenating) n=1 Tax=Rhizophlyctis rosea TaxID=64517 RepID=A0A2U8U9P8_9FUNG|nr:lytic polysaccharide monooxygenase 9 [Rhizophlyctis rosea]
MKLLSTITTGALTVALAAAANAHTYVTNFYVNGVDQGNDVCIRPYYWDQNWWKNFPIKDVRSDDIRCGKKNANTVAAKTCNVPAGGTITLEWHATTRANATDDIIHISHHGPCLAYISPAGKNSWVKIWEDAGNTGGEWCTDRLRKKKGKMEVVIPKALKSGKYDVRGEIIAHHESDANYLENPARGAQFYVACLSISVTNGGSTSLPSGVAFPGAYKATDKGIHYNLYAHWPTLDAPYTSPGPKVWKSSNVVATTKKPAATTKKTTQKPVATTKMTTRKPAARTTRKVTTTRKATKVSTTRKAAATKAPVKVVKVIKVIRVVKA